MSGIIGKRRHGAAGKDEGTGGEKRRKGMRRRQQEIGEFDGLGQFVIKDPAFGREVGERVEKRDEGVEDW